MSNVIVNGASGKMGALACDAIQNHPALQLVGRLGRGDNLQAAIVETKAEIVVDLTNAASVFANSLIIVNSGAHPVIGTSGLSDKEVAELKALCHQKALGGIVVPNFSIGAILMMQFASQAVRYLPQVEIIEMHHQQKQDSPSATALKTAAEIAKTRAEYQEPPSKELIAGARGALSNNVHVHSVRLPGVLAYQQVICGAEGQTLTITHNTLDRAAFMPGLLLACERVTSLDGLYYGLEHLLNDSV